jgi:chromate transport protein ChrA
MDLQEVRDVAIIAFTVAGAVFCLIAIIVTVLTGIAAMGALRAIRKLVDEGVKPMVDNVRGTVTFVSENAVTPIVRTYGFYAGLRRGLGVLSGLGQRGSGKASPKGKK